MSLITTDHQQTTDFHRVLATPHTNNIVSTHQLEVRSPFTRHIWVGVGGPPNVLDSNDL